MGDYHLELTPPSSVLPVSVADLTAHLNLNVAADDDLMERCILTATRLFEKMTGRAVALTGYRQWVKGLPTNLAVSPVVSVNAVKYYSPTEVETTFDGFRADLFSTPVAIYETDNATQSYRETFSVDVSRTYRYPVSVEFSAGYATCPPDIQTAILLGAAHLYAHRGDGDAGLPPGFKTIANLYTVRGFCS